MFQSCAALRRPHRGTIRSGGINPPAISRVDDRKCLAGELPGPCVPLNPVTASRRFPHPASHALQQRPRAVPARAGGELPHWRGPWACNSRTAMETRHLVATPGTRAPLSKPSTHQPGDPRQTPGPGRCVPSPAGCERLLRRGEAACKVREGLPTKRSGTNSQPQIQNRQ